MQRDWRMGKHVSGVYWGPSSLIVQALWAPSPCCPSHTGGGERGNRDSVGTMIASDIKGGLGGYQAPEKIKKQRICYDSGSGLEIGALNWDFITENPLPMRIKKNKQCVNFRNRQSVSPQIIFKCDICTVERAIKDELLIWSSDKKAHG